MSDDTIQLSDGTTIKANELQNGMILNRNGQKKLYVYNIDNSEEGFIMYDLFQKSADILRLTPDHLIETARGEIPVNRLDLGDKSWDSNLNPDEIIVSNIRKCNVKNKNSYRIDTTSPYHLSEDSLPLRDNVNTESPNPPKVLDSKPISPVDSSKPNLAQIILDSGRFISDPKELKSIAKDMGYNIVEGGGGSHIDVRNPEGIKITEISMGHSGDMKKGTSRGILKSLSTNTPSF